MNNPKTPPENKSYYGGIYLYLMNQRLNKNKQSKQTPKK
jgi:hypothetical protein